MKTLSDGERGGGGGGRQLRFNRESLRQSQNIKQGNKHPGCTELSVC